MDKKIKRIYFDYAASTPVDPRVVAAMTPYFTERFGNPGSLHSYGQEAIAAVDSARDMLARLVGASPLYGFREIVFTGSATEANNLAFRGTVRKFWWSFFKDRGTAASPDILPHIITTAIEHESVLETVRDIEARGAARVTVLPVDREGIVDLKKLKAALNEHTVIVSVMYVNNETGTVQPISEIAKIIRNFRETLVMRNEKLGKRPGSSSLMSPISYPLFHTDAAQAFQFLSCNVDALGVDLMTLSAQKIYGPKGAGALYVRHNSPISPLITGGEQEFGLRSGTENVPLIAGFAKAAELIDSDKEIVARRVAGLRDDLWRGIKKFYPKAQLNGSSSSRAPHILNMYFPDMFAEELIMRLDLAGIAVSSGSACRSRSAEPSYVLKAMGYSTDHAKHSIRFSVGQLTTREEIKTLLDELHSILKNKKKGH